jgi:hypothetical protein
LRREKREERREKIEGRREKEGGDEELLTLLPSPFSLSSQVFGFRIS